MPDLDLEQTGIAVAIVTAIGSLLDAIRSSRMADHFNVRLLAIETARERERAIEARMAHLTVSYDGDTELAIKNTGGGTARNVKVFLDGVPFAEHPAALVGEHEPSIIGPWSGATYRIGPAFGQPIPKHIRITWADDERDNADYETSV